MRATASDWGIRQYEPGDVKGIVGLWQLVFGKPMPIETWRWKFLGRPAVAPNIWVAVDGDDQIVGHYAGVPMALKVGSTVVPVFNGVDAMTHPDFRRRGVSTEILRVAHAAWGDAGSPISIGLPNEKLRTWRSVATPAFELSRMRLALRLDEVVRRRGRVPSVFAAAVAPLAAAGARTMRRTWPRADPAVEVRRAGQTDFDWPDLDAVWRHVAPAYDTCVVRDAAWWRWRFAECPQFRYEVLVADSGGSPVGAAAFRVHEEDGARRGVLAELFTRPADAATTDSLMRAVLDALWDAGAGTVHALAPAGGALAARLRGYGFHAQPQGFEYMHVQLTDAGAAVSREPRAWHMSGAEFDVV